MFQAKQDESFPQREERILAFWEKAKIFEKSLKKTEHQPNFSFYDGPPFATGLPHYGHLLAGTIKDVVPRYKTMQGYHVPRRFGWDCHGLPVENEIEKEKQLFGAKAIEEFGIAHFNEECEKIVLRYTKEWKKTVERMGRWVDFSNPYRTMDKNFMESVFWVFEKLYKEGLVYEGFKVMPFSTRLGTPLSNFEANLNYKDVDDPSVVIEFSLQGEKNTFFLVWTTTPWTLVSNLALMVEGESDYVKILDHKSQKNYILAKSRLATHFPEQNFDILETFQGKDLEGKTYQPLFPYFKGHKKAFRVILEPSVSMEEGTGIVHAAPAFGEVDFYACKKEGIDVVCPVDSNGHFTEEVVDYKNIYVKDADKLILRKLKELGKVFFHGQIRHRYPFCWRSDTPLIYKAVETWFVAVEKIRDRLIAANQSIDWVPSHIKEGRFGKWLENARDWAISRNRYWGTPIPIWRSADGEIHVVGSVSELEKLTNTKIDNLHRQYIDSLTFEKNGKTFTRIPEVFDCWFESGSMPYAQCHYPFENKQQMEQNFPADFIAEGLDQTRGWFYTLNVLSVALFNKPAFEHVIVNGIILAEDGTKMSKRLKNYPEPEVVINKFGADAIRFYLLQSPAVQGEDLSFSERGVELVLRQALIPLWNSFFFLATYAKIYHWKPTTFSKTKKNLLDRWILSLASGLSSKVHESMEIYHLNKAVEPFIEFIDHLTNWYIRRSRSRFWAEEDTEDRRDAFETLYYVLLHLSKLLAPFVPYLSEAIYLELRTESMEESVHLCQMPTLLGDRDLSLEKEMEYVQRAVKLGHFLRKEHKIKVRQPLAKAEIAAATEEVLSYLSRQKKLIEDELNVKDIVFHLEEERFVELIVKPNFRLLGKKVGKKMSSLQQKIASFSKKEKQTLLEGKNLSIHLDGESFILEPSDILVERHVKEGLVAESDDELSLALDLTLTPKLLVEGLARELINKINTMRRDQNFEVTDRIEVSIETTKEVQEAFEAFKEFISQEVLATKVTFRSSSGELFDLNGYPSKIKIIKSL